MARKSRKKHLDFDTELKVYKTAIYARLSRENVGHEKIETQIEEVKKYLQNKPMFRLVEIYADNGYSGMSFERPDFQRMMEDVRNQKIDCIVVKDLSRFAREHIGAEDYLNNIFPFLGIRFIAIYDGYDNIHVEPQEYFLASFKNFAHAYMAQETSRKVGTVKRSLQEQGKFVGSKISYGYVRDPSDKHKLVINPEEAEFVKEIFVRIANGETATQVCKAMNVKDNSGYVWTVGRICVILKKEIYKGTLVQRQTITAMYKNQKMQRVPKDQQIRSENAVPAIVSPELWQKAQEMVASRQAQRHMDSPENPYKGMVFCAKCGKKLVSGFMRNLQDFTFNCPNCKDGVYAKGKYLHKSVCLSLNLPDDTEITGQFLSEHFDKILVTDRKHISCVPKGGEES